jgi:hypothetical protein
VPDGARLRCVEYLPFTVRVVRTEEEREQVARLRHEAYGRHLPPGLVEGLRRPDPLYAEPGVAVLLAQSKVDGAPLGTLRIQTNAERPLLLEQSFDLPDWMRGSRCAEITRLAVTNESTSRVVKTVMLKAAYFWCERAQVDYVLVTARAPLDRQYARLMFRDVQPELGFVPLPHVFNLPHRIMFTSIQAARRDGVGHPLYEFWFEPDHPDILLDGDDPAA